MADEANNGLGGSESEGQLETVEGGLSAHPSPPQLPISAADLREQLGNGIGITDYFDNILRGDQDHLYSFGSCLQDMVDEQLNFSKMPITAEEQEKMDTLFQMSLSGISIVFLQRAADDSNAWMECCERLRDGPSPVTARTFRIICGYPYQQQLPREESDRSATPEDHDAEEESEGATTRPAMKDPTMAQSDGQTDQGDSLEVALDAFRDKALDQFQVLATFCETKIQPLLKSGKIALLDHKWLLFEFHEKRLPRRQELPAEAFIDYDDAKMVIVLSYMWLSKEHPDPYGTTLELVKKGLMSIKGEKLDEGTGIFWDFPCLFQHPRTSNEDACFREALQGMPYLYLNPKTIVFQVRQLPSSITLEGRNATPYIQRGWTFAEQAWSTLIKEDTEAMIHDLSSLDRGTEGSYLENHAHLRVPLLPDAFDSVAEGLSFSNGKEDHDLVKALYRNSLISLGPMLTEMRFARLHWTPKEVQRFADFASGGYTRHVRIIDLSNNMIGDEIPKALKAMVINTNELVLKCTGLTERGCQALMTELANENLSELKLTSLNLDQNSIGNEGFVCLAPLLIHLQGVSFFEGGFTAVGCRGFVDALPEGSLETSRIQDINLTATDIGGEGMAILAPLILRARKYTAFSVGLTDDGCKHFMSSVTPEMLEYAYFEQFRLDGNGIGEEGVAMLAPLLIRTKIVGLTDIGLTPSGCEKLSSSIKSLSQEVLDKSPLAFLWIADNPSMTDLGVEALAPILSQLQVIDLSACGLTDYTPRILNACSQAGGTVRWVYLDLSNNEITSCTHLMKIIENNTRGTLTKLFINGNPLTRELEFLSMVGGGIEQASEDLLNLMRLAKRHHVEIFKPESPNYPVGDRMMECINM